MKKRKHRPTVANLTKPKPLSPQHRKRAIEDIASTASRSTDLVDETFRLICLGDHLDWNIIRSIVRELTIDLRYMRDQANVVLGKV